ncbi:hypothetical protein SAMN05216223_13262 [Actinacidiphila yanglinensis]|uniref:Uncharacterized protein n=2 Tax=Actinacidiphila yanglinensis TaxID=310779 RepID=A0A1H6EEI2_9ACTN|nr:hypothetical protein SAMN05216223_13262 [Actinacidiphila yanglinensis]
MVFGALYGLALAVEGDSVREKVVRAANAAGWAVERADPAERTADPHSLAVRANRWGDDYSPVRGESDIQMIAEMDPLAQEHIDGERMGATLYRLRLLGEFFASASGPAPEGGSDQDDEPRKEAA